jgi:putative ABC transport system substrate-binding protein
VEVAQEAVVPEEAGKVKFYINVKMFSKLKSVLLFIFFLIIYSCTVKNDKPVIGFLDLLQDETLSKAKDGFYNALKDEGLEDGKNLEIIYRNAQNDQQTLVSACDYLISRNVLLIATNPTLSTITAVQKTRNIPVFMMVSPRPDVAGLTDASGRYPSHLFGVYETLEYIDTSLMVMNQAFPGIKKIGTIFNQSEPQSVDALNQIEKTCKALNIQLEKLPVNNSNEAQLVIQSLLRKKIQAFFALPDNTVFSSMETIVKVCDGENVPVFTCEEGLVRRGAVAAFGADMYQWGYQSGKQAAAFLKSKDLSGLKPEMVKVRHKVYNEAKARQFNLYFDSTFTSVK